MKEAKAKLAKAKEDIKKEEDDEEEDAEKQKAARALLAKKVAQKDAIDKARGYEMEKRMADHADKMAIKRQVEKNEFKRKEALKARKEQ